MSDHCRFLFVPAGGSARIIDSHPRPDVVSDLLGGAFAAPVILPSGRVAAWVRETCATEGQPRNVLASVLAMILGGPRPIPILGPCALTMLVWTSNPGDPYPVGTAEGFPGGDEIERFRRLTEDVERALAGYSYGFQYDHLDEAWAEAVRGAAETCRTMPIPDGWPSVARQDGSDEVALLMRRLGLGQMFAPVPISAN